MGKFIRVGAFVVIGMAVGGLVAGLIAFSSSSIAPGELSRVVALAWGGDRTAWLRLFVDNNQSVGLINLWFWPVSIGVAYGLDRLWAALRHEQFKPSERKGWFRLLESVVVGLAIGAWVYAAWTVLIMGSFPGIDVPARQLNEWGRTLETRGTLSVIGWIAGGILVWWWTRERALPYFPTSTDTETTKKWASLGTFAPLSDSSEAKTQGE